MNQLLLLLFIAHLLIRYESSRGHKIDGTKPNQTGNTLGEKTKKQKKGKQSEENGQESSQQKTSSLGRDTEEAIK